MDGRIVVSGEGGERIRERVEGLPLRDILTQAITILLHVADGPAEILGVTAVAELGGRAAKLVVQQQVEPLAGDEVADGFGFGGAHTGFTESCAAATAGGVGGRFSGIGVNIGAGGSCHLLGIDIVININAVDVGVPFGYVGAIQKLSAVGCDLGLAGVAQI